MAGQQSGEQEEAAMRTRAGQSTLEYVLVLAVIVLAIVAAAAGPIRRAVDGMFNDSAANIENATGRLGR